MNLKLKKTMTLISENNILYVAFLFFLSISTCSCTRCSMEKQVVELAENSVDSIVLPAPSHACAWSFDEKYGDNSYDINFFNSDSVYLYSISINAPSSTSLSGSYNVDTTKYNFISIPQSSDYDEFIYSVSGKYEIKKIGDKLYHFNGACLTQDSALIVFDFDAPIDTIRIW